MSKKDTTWKKHKYIKKVTTKSGRTRYVYSGEDEDAMSYDFEEAMYEIQQMPEGKEKEAAMKDWYYKKQQFDELNESTQNMFHSDEELYHYGVLGMRWGIHRGRAREAVDKSARTVKKLQAKAEKAGRKVSAKADYKASKLERKAAKYERKSAKVRRKATRWFMPMNADKAERKMGKYDLKASRYSERASKIRTKQANAKYKQEKYEKKAKKLAAATVKAVEKKNIKDIDTTNLEYLKKYAA